MGFLRNNLLHGLLLGLLVPVLAFLFWWLLNMLLLQLDITTQFGEPFQFSLKTRLLLSIAMNLIPTQWASGRRWDATMRGTGVVTMLMMLGWAFYYYSGQIL